MPIYAITDQLTGKQYEFTGNQPPTDEQILNLIEPPEQTQDLLSAVNTLKINKSPTTSGLGKSNQAGIEREQALIRQQQKIDQPKTQQLLPSSNRLS